MRCAAGTYVRALARDLGELLGTGGAPDGAAADAQRRLRSRTRRSRSSAIGDAASLLPLDALLPELARGAASVRAAPRRSASDATSRAI